MRLFDLSLLESEGQLGVGSLSDTHSAASMESAVFHHARLEAFTWSEVGVCC